MLQLRILDFAVAPIKWYVDNQVEMMERVCDLLEQSFVSIPIKHREVSEKIDWTPLVNLVRIPSVKEIRCPDSPDKQCRLSGSNLFLLESVASDPQFTHNIPVPAGFADTWLSVPRPNGTLLYIKLRDEPGTANMAVLPVLPDDR